MLGTTGPIFLHFFVDEVLTILCAHAKFHLRDQIVQAGSRFSHKVLKKVEKSFDL